MRCDFEKLVLYMEKRLKDVDSQLEVLVHIDSCEPCREAIYHLALDRDSDLFVTPSRVLDLEVDEFQYKSVH